MRLAAVAVASLLRLLHLAAPVACTKVTIVRKEGLLTAGPPQGNVAVLLSIDASARARRSPAGAGARQRPGGRNGSGGAGGGARSTALGDSLSSRAAANLSRSQRWEGSSLAKASPPRRPDGRELRRPAVAKASHARGDGGGDGAQDALHGNKTAVEKLEKVMLQQLEKPVLTHLVGEMLGKGPSQLPVRRAGALRLYVCAGALVLVCGCGYVYCALNGARPEALYGYTQTGVKRVCPSTDISSFLQAYNQAPHKVRFRFIGHRDDVGGIGRYMRPFSHQRITAFDVALDLAPFICDKACVAQPQLDIMGNFLATRNVLESISIQKTVAWEGWEDVAQCVRRRLRELGFSGRVDALLECDEQLVVFWNHPWSNFLRSWIVQLVLYLSVAGGLLYVPYMAFRAKTLPVQLQFRVRIEPSQYWDLIRVGVCADKGFVAR